MTEAQLHDKHTAEIADEAERELKRVCRETRVCAVCENVGGDNISGWQLCETCAEDVVNRASDLFLFNRSLNPGTAIDAAIREMRKE